VLFRSETSLAIESPLSRIKVPHDVDNLDGLEFLAGTGYDDINKKAFKGTLLAHYQGNVPNMIFNIPELSPYYIGQLIYIFELACGISGYILNVNPFDQPGVEAYKNNMFALLDKPGESNKKNRALLEEKIKLLPKGKITE
jgi:glucose-6-phosphate isomerase